MSTSVAAFSYSIAAAAFLLLSGLLLTSWRARLHSVVLTVACLITAVWAALIAYQLTEGGQLSQLTSILEILRNAGWSIFLLILLGPFQKAFHQNSLRLRPHATAIALFYALLLLASVFPSLTSAALFGETGFIVEVVGRLIAAIIGMLLVEQLYRNTPVKERWGIKFACLGIGGMFAYDFFLYSETMLFRQIDTEIWAARGIIDALIVPLIAVSAARNAQWSMEIAVSRRVVFHSAALFGSAAYLLIMAAAGYYLRFFGGSWGMVMQTAFLFGAIVLLVGVLFSGAFRSWLKVFISKNFYNYNYDYREEWLRFTRILSEEQHGLGERTIQALAGLVESPGGALYIRRESGNCELVAQWNMVIPNAEVAAGSAFYQFLESKQWLIDLQEYAATPEKYGGVEIPQWLRNAPKAWLVAPLILHGSLLGFVVLAQPRSSIKLNWEVVDLLKTAGSQAASYIAQQESAKALMVARQFESFNRMSTFVVHDLKNLITQLSLLLSNAEKHRSNPEFQKDMLETVDLSVQKMKLLLHKLARGVAIEHPSPINIDKLLHQAIATKAAFEPQPAVQILHPGLSVLADWSRLERVIGHIIQNAIEATPKDGKVMICVARQDDFVSIEISDTGQGMSEEFMRERLFQPFESTKSAGMGIGVFESREYIQALGGRIEVVSHLTAGTTFRLILPLFNSESPAVALQA